MYLGIRMKSRFRGGFGLVLDRKPDRKRVHETCPLRMLDLAPCRHATFKTQTTQLSTPSATRSVLRIVTSLVSGVRNDVAEPVMAGEFQRRSFNFSILLTRRDIPPFGPTPATAAIAAGCFIAISMRRARRTFRSHFVSCVASRRRISQKFYGQRNEFQVGSGVTVGHFKFVE